MRNLKIYLILLLFLFANKMLAQDSIQKEEQMKQTYGQALKEYEIKREKIKQEEEKIYNEEINKLNKQRRKKILSKQEFEDQVIALEKKKKSNIAKKSDLYYKKLIEQFPDTGAVSFEGKAKNVINGIKNDIYFEKQLLKKAIDSIDQQLVKGFISQKEAENQKVKLAESTVKIIDEKIQLRQKYLSQLAQQQIDGKLPNPVNDGGMSLTLIGNNISQKTKRGDIDARMNFSLPAMKAYKGQTDKDRQQNKRTSSQIVFAIGANNLATKGSVDNSDFRYWQSRFYEWGLTFNSRIIPNHNLLHAKYGLSLMYNDLKPTDNRYFVVNGNQTDLETNPVHQDDFRFRNVNLVVPLHLEFDFTKPTIKNGKSYFKTHNSFRLGVGGYFGANVKSKQTIKYDIDGYQTVEKTKGSFNTNDFVYGLSTYLGYKATSLYLKYDLNPLFKDNVVKQNNVSLGVRFDFN